jgi:hypothetical protein
MALWNEIGIRGAEVEPRTCFMHIEVDSFESYFNSFLFDMLPISLYLILALNFDAASHPEM